MSVLACSRKNCNNIMCDTYVDTYVDSVGYVCFDCQEQFKQYANKRNISLNTEDIIVELKEFMNTEKVCSDIQEYSSIDSFFKGFTN